METQTYTTGMNETYSLNKLEIALECESICAFLVYFVATIYVLRGIYNVMDRIAKLTVILFNLCLLLNAAISVLDLLDALNKKEDKQGIKLLKRISSTFSFIILFSIELYYTIQLKAVIDMIKNEQFTNNRRTKRIHITLQVTIVIALFTQIMRDKTYDIEPVTTVITTISIFNVLLRLLSLVPLFILQLIYLIKFYRLYGEACNFVITRRASALRFFLFSILVTNSVNSTAFNISDLLKHFSNYDYEWMDKWRQFTDMLFELFMTVNGMGFLIIFQLIAKMKIANETTPKRDYSENLFHQEMTHSNSNLKESTIYGS